MLPDIERVSAIIREVAAIEIMPRFRNLEAHEVRQKSGPGDLVTVADEAAERALTARLLDLLPGSLVVGEEGVAADPAVLERLDSTEPLWILDPVDGTGNFAAGKPIFAVMVAHMRQGRTVAGWIYDPVGDHMAVAVSGDGVFLDGSRKHLPPVQDIHKMVGSVSPAFFPTAERRRLQERIKDLSTVDSLFCAGHTYLSILRDEVQYMLTNSSYAWDHAPGQLMYAEAGGYGARFDGAPYRMADARGGLLAAPDKASWMALHRQLLPDYKLCLEPLLPSVE